MSSDGFDGVTTGGAGRRRTSVVAAGVAVLVLAGASFAFAARSGDDPDTAPVAADQVDVDGSQAPSGDAPPDGADGDGPDGGADDAAQAERDRADAEAAAERAAEEAAAEAAEAAEAERLAEEERAAEEARLAEERAEQERLEAEQRAREEQERFVAGQQRLIELGYLVGAADGEAGQQTTSAVMAFQAVNGLSVDGALGPQTYAALDAPRDPALRGGPATRLEVDMDRQVLHLVEGGQRVTTMKVSTGRGGTFESAAGETLRAETPVGTFTIDRRIAGEKPSSYGIGSMWDPMYFHGPWAIHGSPNVPAGPASSGCVRVALADGRWLFDRVPNGTPVVLYGGTHVFEP